MTLTDLQFDAVRDEVSIMLSDIFPDYSERHALVDLIANDVANNIEETADWSGYAEDEYCLADIRLALSRILSDAVRFFYLGE